jgi:hypothetical protein
LTQLSAVGEVGLIVVLLRGGRELAKKAEELDCVALSLMRRMAGGARNWCWAWEYSPDKTAAVNQEQQLTLS